MIRTFALDYLPEGAVSLRGCRACDGRRTQGVAGTLLRAGVDGTPVLVRARTKSGPEAGGVGLWGGVGTEGYVTDQRVTPA